MSWSEVETGRSPPGSDGRFSSVPSKASVVEPPRVERRAGDGAEPDQRLRELEVRHADAVARLAAVGRDEEHAAVRELPDGGARVAGRELGRA